ncbi:MAG: hypothetical protein JST52_11235 [Bacteroidetes bacterium]|nr:hypothetical protein [Bacteroidota bacterium]MBS1739957.1 hypothetical protein [Bacteroidota bacterium]
MHNPFQAGDTKKFLRKVQAADTATFDSGEVHPVYATFALARDAEWSGRLFVLEMKDEDEEGIGTGIDIRHLSPALVEEEVCFIATLVEVNKNEVVTDFVAMCGARMIANGRQWQKIVKKQKLETLFAGLQNF